MHVVLPNLQVAPTQSPDLYNSVLAKITALESLIAGGQPLAQSHQNHPLRITLCCLPYWAEAASTSASGAVDAHSVQFPPGSAGAEHAFFPLVGKHAQLACESCHANGRFAGTPNTCVACHTQDKPAVHFVGDCAACHTAVSWQDIHFNHQVAGATDCVACHTKDKPANHFSGQCSNCHNTTNWTSVHFDHTGLTDCASCHTKDKPANHFDGQCSACHNTSNWKNAHSTTQFANATTVYPAIPRISPPTTSTASARLAITPPTGKTPNLTMRRPMRPTVSPATPRISPPTTSMASVRIVIIPAAGKAPIRPHRAMDRLRFLPYQGQARQPLRWAVLDLPQHQQLAKCHFDHTGLTDCASCHTKDKPANHFDGQCSTCHNTSNWQNAKFDHTGLTDCASCHTKDKPANHFDGQCSNCHSTSDWQNAKFDHTGLTDCASCHTKDKPANHYSGQCSNCHNTSSWQNANFNHTGLTDCQSCHSRINPPTTTVGSARTATIPAVGKALSSAILA